MTEFREAAAAVRTAHSIATDARAEEILAIAKSGTARRGLDEAETRFRAAEQALAASERPAPTPQPALRVFARSPDGDVAEAG